MNTQTLIHNARRLLLASLALAAGAASASALSISHNLSDPYITVGESFAIEVVLDFDPSHGLEGYAFNVSTGPGLDFKGADLPSGSWVLGGSFYDVDVLVDPFDPAAPVGGTPLVLATLNFDALSTGLATISLLGSDGGLFEGIYLFDLFTYDSIQEDIDETLNVAVHVPDGGSSNFLLGGALLILGGLSRRKRNAILS